jgi:WD40 repeat protein
VGDDGVVRIWTVDGGEEAASWQAGQGELRAVAFVGAEVATGGDDVRLWDDRGKRLVTLDRHTRPVTALQAIEGGKKLLSLAEGEALLWPLAELRSGLREHGLGW